MPDRYSLFGNPLKTNPVRLYSIGVALVALGAYFVPSGAWPLVLGLVAAVLGVGETVRNRVTPYDPAQDDAGQSVLVTALIAAAVCVVLLLAFDLIHIT